MNETINRGFFVSIYEDKTSGNCSNNGLSHQHKEAMIVSNIKELQIFDITPKSELTNPLIMIKTKNVGGEEYIYAEPLDSIDKSNVGWMMGGTFIYSCDSRFKRHVSQYPIPLHDRQETPELYDRLNR